MVDVTSVLAATELVKKLVQTGKKLGEADFKLLLADLQGLLADARLESIALKEENATLKQRIKELEEGALPACPRCGKRTWAVISSAEDETFGVLGVSRRQYQCSACKFSESKLDDQASSNRAL